MPCILKCEVLPGHEGHEDRGRVVRQHGLPGSTQRGKGKDIGGVVAPTRKPPMPRETVVITRLFDGGCTIVDGRAGAADRTVVDQDTTGHVCRQVDAHHAVQLGPDHDAPPGRPVRGRDGFDHLKIGAAVDLETAQSRRHHEVEQLRVEERLDYRGGQIPLSFCVWRFLAHQSCNANARSITACCVAMLTFFLCDRPVPLCLPCCRKRCCGNTAKRGEPSREGHEAARASHLGLSRSLFLDSGGLGFPGVQES